MKAALAIAAAPSPWPTNSTGRSAALTASAIARVQASRSAAPTSAGATRRAVERFASQRLGQSPVSAPPSPGTIRTSKSEMRIELSLTTASPSASATDEPHSSEHAEERDHIPGSSGLGDLHLGAVRAARTPKWSAMTSIGATRRVTNKAPKRLRRLWRQRQRLELLSGGAKGSELVDRRPDSGKT